MLRQKKFKIHASIWVKLKDEVSVEKYDFTLIQSTNYQIFKTMLSVRMISLIFIFHGMIYKEILVSTVAHIAVKIVPHWFLTTQTYNYNIVDICKCKFLFLKLFSNVCVVVVKIDVKIIFIIMIKNLCRAIFLLGYLS